MSEDESDNSGSFENALLNGTLSLTTAVNPLVGIVARVAVEILKNQDSDSDSIEED